MATEIVAGQQEHALWLGDDFVLSYSLDNATTGFPPSMNHVQAIHRMIQGLTRATRAVIYQAENDEGEFAFLMQPATDLSDAILLLSQLAAAVQSHLAAE